MINFGGKPPIFCYFRQFLVKPPLFKENLPKKGPLFREFGAQKPPIWVAHTRTLNILCTPPPPGGRSVKFEPGSFLKMGCLRKFPLIKGPFRRLKIQRKGHSIKWYGRAWCTFHYCIAPTGVRIDACFSASPGFEIITRPRFRCYSRGFVASFEREICFISFHLIHFRFLLRGNEVMENHAKSLWHTYTTSV